MKLEVYAIMAVYTPLKVSLFPRIQAIAQYGLKMYNFEETARFYREHSLSLFTKNSFYIFLSP